jgi:hypothetical protein
VKYKAIDIPSLDQVYLKLRYSKYSPASVSILIHLDDEPNPRAALNLVDQGDWNRFASTPPIPLGKIVGGIHSLKFSTDGQQYGVADLDQFVLTASALSLTPLSADLRPGSTKVSSRAIAVYVPQPAETPVTAKWDNPQAVCEGESLYRWSSPGIYLYRTYPFGNSRTVEQKSRRSTPREIPCPSVSGRDFGSMLAEPPKIGLSTGRSYACGDGTNNLLRGSLSFTVVGINAIETSWGLLPAVQIDTVEEYDVFTGTHDSLKGIYRISEWYACGLGLIRSMTLHTGTINGSKIEDQSEELLLSFTPVSTNEAHVRYILADIQIGNVLADYRADISDEETAEALRRWDAGVRVVNSEEFERQFVAGHWSVVYAGTGHPANGLDINLSSDPK